MVDVVDQCKCQLNEAECFCHIYKLYIGLLVYEIDAELFSFAAAIVRTETVQIDDEKPFASVHSSHQVKV